jgi:hypothetical protein
MTKTLTISLITEGNESKFQVAENDQKMEILKKDLLVSGQKIYESFFKDVSLSEKIEIKFQVDSSISDSGDVRIAKDIQSIFSKIIDAINEEIEKKKAAKEPINDDASASKTV